MSIKRFMSEEGEAVLYRDHTAALEAVKATVKPLEWLDDADDGWIADTTIGDYELHRVGYLDVEQWELINAVERIGYFDIDRLEAAKAAAQADYEQRILSAIVPSPSLEAKTPMIYMGEADEAYEAGYRDGKAAFEANQQVIETLRAALQPFATDADIYDGQSIIDGEKSFLNDNLTVGDLRRARAALASTKKIGGAS